MSFAGLWTAVAVALAGPFPHGQPNVVTVGPSVVQETLAQQLCGGKSREVALDMVTYNTWGMPFPMAPKRQERLPKIGQFLEESGYSVAGLQEVWRGARKMLGFEGLFLPKIGRGDGDSGLAVASKWPVLDASVRYFEDAVGFDAWKKKGVLATQVDSGEAGPLWVVVTHLQSGPGLKAAEVRSKQIDDILDLLKDLDGPAVVMGDFNLYGKGAKDLETVARMAEAGLVDVAEAVGVTEQTYRWEAERLDRIFVRSFDDGVCVVPESSEVLHDGVLGSVGALLSDHLPLAARVKVLW